jgi:hypothetical protein
MIDFVIHIIEKSGYLGVVFLMLKAVIDERDASGGIAGEIVVEVFLSV